MNNQDVVGPWKLQSLVATSREGEEFYPFGPTPAGMIMYDVSGYMSYTAMRIGRPKFASGDLGGGTPDEVKAAFESFDAYCGTYEISRKDGIITHHVEASRFPNWEGTDQIRFFQISENQLRISTPPIQFQNTEWVIRLVFIRPEGFSASNH